MSENKINRGKSRLTSSTTEKYKVGRFECTVTREYYTGQEEFEAQVKALRKLKSIVLPENK